VVNKPSGEWQEGVSGRNFGSGYSCVNKVCSHFHWFLEYQVFSSEELIHLLRPGKVHYSTTCQWKDNKGLEVTLLGFLDIFMYFRCCGCKYAATTLNQPQ
jgi:hypothetical protein